MCTSLWTPPLFATDTKSNSNWVQSPWISARQQIAYHWTVQLNKQIFSVCWKSLKSNKPMRKKTKKRKRSSKKGTNCFGNKEKNYMHRVRDYRGTIGLRLPCSRITHWTIVIWCIAEKGSGRWRGARNLEGKIRNVNYFNYKHTGPSSKNK